MFKDNTRQRQGKRPRQRTYPRSLATKNAGYEDRILDAVGLYLAWGWFVVPLHSILLGGGCTCGRDCDSAGKHPLTLHGIYDAQRIETALAWWRRWPWGNVGILAGASGLAVLDIDPRNGGDQSLSALLSEHGELPPTLTATTGGGGAHYVFSDPSRRLRSSKIAQGVDFLARASLFVVEPSIHRSGSRYEWLNRDEVPAPVPEWLSEQTRSTGEPR